MGNKRTEGGREKKEEGGGRKREEERGEDMERKRSLKLQQHVQVWPPFTSNVIRMFSGFTSR